MSSLPNHGGSDISNLLMSSSSRAIGASSEALDFQTPAPFGAHAIGSQGINSRQFEASRYLLPQDRALSKEIAFELLTQGSIAPIAPCRASASPIDKRVAFFFVTGKPTIARNAADSALEVSVSFQSIANSEPWWSPNVHNGQRLGLVARHMSRRTRVQGKSVGGATGGDPHGSGGGYSSAGAGNTRGGADELHGYQGRWFCLVQAPCHLIGDKPVKLKCAKAVPGAFSLVQVWAAPDAEMSNALRGKRKRPPPKMHPNSGPLALCSGGHGSSGYGDRQSASHFANANRYGAYHGDGSGRDSANNSNGGPRGGVGSLGLPGAQRPLGMDQSRGGETEQTGFNSFGSFDPRSLLLLRAGVEGGRVISGPDTSHGNTANAADAANATARSSHHNGKSDISSRSREAFNVKGFVRGWSRSHTTDGNPSRIASSIAKRGGTSSDAEEDDGSDSDSTGSDEHDGSSEPSEQMNGSATNTNGWNSSGASRLPGYQSGDAAGTSRAFARALDGSAAAALTDAEQGFPLLLSGPTATFTSSSTTSGPRGSMQQSQPQQEQQQSQDWLLTQQQQQQQQQQLDAQQQQAQLHQHFMQQARLQLQQKQQQQRQQQQQFQQAHAVQESDANVGTEGLINHFLQGNPNASLNGPTNIQHGGINHSQNSLTSSPGLSPLPSSAATEIPGGNALALQQQQLFAFGQLVQQLQDVLNQERQERQRLELVTRHLQQQVDALTQKPSIVGARTGQQQQLQQQQQQLLPPGLQMLQPKPEPRAPPPPLLPPPPPYDRDLLYDVAAIQQSFAPPPSSLSVGPSAATTPNFAPASSALSSFAELDAAHEKLNQQDSLKEANALRHPPGQQLEQPAGVPFSSSSSSSSFPCPTPWPPRAPVSAPGDVPESEEGNGISTDTTLSTISDV